MGAGDALDDRQAEPDPGVGADTCAAALERLGQRFDPLRREPRAGVLDRELHVLGGPEVVIHTVPWSGRLWTIAGGRVHRRVVASRSGHSRGSAVDLTLYRLDSGRLVAMGGGHDLMDERSHHGARGIAHHETRNRCALCSVMEASEFERYDHEWWHHALRDEPYPDTCFDFPIR